MSIPEIRVNSPAGVQTYSISDLRARLQRIRQNSELAVGSVASPQVADDHAKVTEMLRATNGTDAYNQIYHEITSAFKGYQPRTPGTYGAFYTGCLMSSGPDGKNECNPYCTGGLAPPDNSPNWNGPCEHQTFAHANGRFSALNNVDKKDNAIVYVTGDSFGGFSDSEIQQLRNTGVKNVRVYTYGDNGFNYQLVHPASADPDSFCFVSLDSTTIRSGVAGPTPGPTPVPPVHRTVIGSLWWLLALIILVVIVALLIWAFSRKAKKAVVVASPCVDPVLTGYAAAVARPTC